MAKIIEWQCIACGRVLGEVLGGELLVGVDSGFARTRGANLTLKCPACGAEKTWYTADPVVRAIYQLVDAISSQAAKRMVDVTVKQIEIKTGQKLS